MYSPHFKSLTSHTLNINTNTPTSLGNLQIVKTRGLGTSSQIKLGKDLATQKQYAMRILKPEAGPTLSPAQAHEACVSNLLNEDGHPCILELATFTSNLEYFKKNGTVKKVAAYLVELAEEGDLFDYISNHGPLPEEVARYYFHDLLDVLDSIHQKGIALQSLKLENVLLAKDYSLKLADFSSAFILGNQTQLPDQGRGPVSDQSGNFFQKDLFSCGVILFTMLTGVPPFNEASWDPLYNLIVKQKFDLFWKQHERRGISIKPELKDLLNSLFTMSSQKRSIAEVKAHSWCTGVRRSILEAQEMTITMDKNGGNRRGQMEEEEEKRQSPLPRVTAQALKVPNGYFAFHGIKPNMSGKKLTT